jgi:hypothetical protein
MTIAQPAHPSTEEKDHPHANQLTMSATHPCTHGGTKTRGSSLSGDREHTFVACLRPRGRHTRHGGEGNRRKILGTSRRRRSPKFAWGLLDKVAWVRGGLITFNTNLSRFSARSHISLLVILVIRARPDTEGSNADAGTESIKMSTLASG